MGSSVLRDARRIVVKVGSSLVTNEGRGLDRAAIAEHGFGTCLSFAHQIFGQAGHQRAVHHLQSV